MNGVGVDYPTDSHWLTPPHARMASTLLNAIPSDASGILELF
jgi:hypothetical protein